MEIWTNPESWIALATLAALEIVLGIDNIIFISIIAGRLPEEQQAQARRIGLFLAMFVRIALLFSLSWLIGLTAPLFSVFGRDISGKDLILIFGGLFLLGKATYEIHERLEGEEHGGDATRKATASFASVIILILLLDIVFSLDSVITAIGMAESIWIMVVAVVIAVLVMLAAAGPINNFVQRHPTVKMLALSFLLLIGFNLMAEGFHVEIPKGYLYFAMAFSVFVELLNLRMRRGKAVDLHNPYYAKDKVETVDASRHGGMAKA